MTERIGRSAGTENDLCPTGVPGLDSILRGGLPRNRLYLLEGDPGAGKTTLALQFLFEGARQGECALYVPLSENKEELRGVAESHGWPLDQIEVIELLAIEHQLQAEAENTFFHPSEVELNRITRVLLAEIDRLKPARIVFDSLSELRLMSETPLRYRRQVLRLKQFFSGKQCTVLVLDDRSSRETKDLQVQSLAHGVISMEHSSPDYGVTRRYLNVVKVRGLKYREGFHDFVIQKGGLVVFPRPEATLQARTPRGEPFCSGIPALDALLGGGLHRGTSSMFLGPPGTGKSTLAMKHAAQAAGRGERVNMYLFDETLGTLLERGKALGMDLTPHLESGKLCVEVVDPAEISPGELSFRIRQAVENDNLKMVVIDSLNGYMNAMPEERYLSLQLHELLAYLNQRGVLTIMVLAQQGLINSPQSTLELTYLADTVVLLRFFEAHGAVKQAISVIKKRSGNHERTLREFSIDERGIYVGEPLRHFHGVLNGVPEYVGNGESAAQARSEQQRGASARQNARS
ncbi:MAG TPA: ATPase domain-containing protein [Candidatus Binatia bacterium]|nr:ATPase domain-containing protein [Candidatus Binatia bacterium]